MNFIVRAIYQEVEGELSEKQFAGRGFSSTSLTVVEIMQKFGFDKRIEEEK